MVHKPRTGLDSLPFACGLGDACRRSNSKNKPKKRKALDESHAIISQLCSFRVGDQILAAISESENWYGLGLGLGQGPGLGLGVCLGLGLGVKDERVTALCGAVCCSV
jgi:hypothetical protein